MNFVFNMQLEDTENMLEFVFLNEMYLNNITHIFISLEKSAQSTDQ